MNALTHCEADGVPRVVQSAMYQVEQDAVVAQLFTGDSIHVPVVWLSERAQKEFVANDWGYKSFVELELFVQENVSHYDNLSPRLTTVRKDAISALR